MPPASVPSPPDPMAAAMARMWAKFLPEIDARMAILEEAAQAASANTLSLEQREAAHAAAHKLAGSLGMFGLHRGTELARDIELAMAESPASAAAEELTPRVAELRALIAGRA